MCTSNAQKVEHGALGFEDGATTNGADFNRGHGDANLQAAVVAKKFISIFFFRM